MVSGSKHRENNRNDDNGDDAFDIALEDEDPSKQNGRVGGRKGGKEGRGKKRDFRDAKFGLCGKKRGMKSNTRDSTNDMSKFNVKKMKGGVSKGGRGGNKKSAAQQRPGKARRAAIRKGK